MGEVAMGLAESLFLFLLKSVFTVPSISHIGSTFAFRKRWGQIDWRSLGEFIEGS